LPHYKNLPSLTGKKQDHIEEAKR